MRTNRREFLSHSTAVMTTAAACLLPGARLPADEIGAAFTLWQLPEQTRSQMMSYVLKTHGNRIIVIDGGTRGDAPYLRTFLEKLGNHVDLWILTHPHSDHVDAVVEIMKDPKGITVDRFYGSFPPRDWIAEHEKSSAVTIEGWEAVAKEKSLTLVEPELGEMLTVDGVTIEFLGLKNLEFTVNAINNSSIAFLVATGKTRILFTGDLGLEGGRKLLHSPFGKQVRADIVQMAHHGQNGVDKAFYEALAPKHCLWPTPKWLWDVDNGGGKGSGPWKTLEVRQWMEELGVKKHSVTWQGEACLELP